MDKGLLQGFSLFADADDQSLEAIAKGCRVLDFGAGDQVFAQEAGADRFYGVVDGSVELVLMLSEEILKSIIEYEEALSVSKETLEKPMVVETLGAGEVFGWSAMVVPPGRWTATARCTCPTRVFSLPAADLKARFEADPLLGYRFMSRLGGVIARRLHQRTGKLLDAWGEAFGGHPR